MSKSTRGIRAAGFASLAVSLSMGVAAPVFADADFEFTRVGGEDRYETAADVADVYGNKPDAILANGQPGRYADALASNYLAKVKDAPILLTRLGGIPGHTLDQLSQMGAKNVWVVGGPAVVPESQVTQLESAGYVVTRIAGEDRYETDAKVIAENGPSTGGVGLIATGQNFPDALAAGPFAYQGHSLGLTRTNSLPDVVGDALVADGVKEVLIFGGTDAVGPAVVTELAARGITVKARFAGADRSETSELAAEWALTNLGFTNKHVGVASGYPRGFGADALAGGPLEGKDKAPMLITRSESNPDDVLDYLKAHCQTLETGHLFGGPVAITPAAETAMEAAARCATASNQTYSATGTSGDAAVNTVSVNDGTNDNRGARTYTFSVGNATVVDIALIPADEVTVAQNGTVTFGDNEGTANQADDLGNTQATIETVNGVAATGGDYINNVAVSGGTVTFSVDSLNAGSVRPVVFTDANANDALDLAANDQPTEAFGVGGVKTWVPTEAPTGQLTADEAIASVDKNLDYIVANGKTYNYDTNDVFQIASSGAASGNEASVCTNTTLANFEANLSSGDELDRSTNYTREEAASSTFCLEDISPAKVMNVDAQPVSASSITVTWSSVSGANSYNVYRVVDTTPTTDCPAATQLVGSVTAPTTTFTDTGLSADTTYCYQVAAVQDGDEGAKSDADTGTDAANDAKARTLSAGQTAEPVSDDVRVITDANFPGEADAGDVWRILFSEPMNTNTTGDVIRVQDAQGEFANLTCGTQITCSFNASPVTIGGTTYEAGRVLTVQVVSIPSPLGDNDGNAANNNGSLNYPLTITNASGFVDTDPTPKPWTPVGDPDNVIDAEAGTQPVVNPAPTMQSAVADESANTVAITYSEAVQCTADAELTQWDYTDTDNTDATPTAYACSGSTVTLTFAAGVVQVADGNGTVEYTQSATAANRVEDLDGVDAVSPDSEAATVQA